MSNESPVQPGWLSEGEKLLWVPIFVEAYRDTFPSANPSDRVVFAVRTANARIQALRETFAALLDDQFGATPAKSVTYDVLATLGCFNVQTLRK